MYIEPNTQVIWLTDVPLDNTYRHTIYFSDKTKQVNYFKSKKKYEDNNLTYQRVSRGVIRVQRLADTMYDVNYMMFKNTAYGNKWFFAFITGVEYVNNVTTYVTYEIDDLQTWFFDFSFQYCFIERQHTVTDHIGDNIAPEPVEVGEYIVSDYEPLTQMSDMLVIIAVVDINSVSEGQLYDGIYGGCKLFAYKSTDVKSINDKISEYAQATDSIVSMYMCPAILIPEVPDSGKVLSYGSSGVKTTVVCDSLTKVIADGKGDFDGYIPKNNKLYTYPYNYFNIDNASGNTLPLRYEFFKLRKPVIEITGTITQPVRLVARPCSYKGVPDYSELGGYTTLNTESITLESYPMCSWNTDAFKAWVAQNSVPIAIDTISNVVSLGMISDNRNAVFDYKGIEEDNPLRSGINTKTTAVNGIASILKSTYRASISADICRGTINNGGVNTASGKQQFYKSRCHITKYFAKMIDSFFSMYGYAVNLVQIPNVHARPHWTYIKTRDCAIIGHVPADVVRKICDIHDNGITYWANGDEVENYSIDNRPVSE